MTKDEALKRGAEAGVALRQALTDICGDKADIAIRAAVIAMTVILTTPPAQACHRFSVWKYSFPQRCAVMAEKTWYVEFQLPKVEQPPEPKPPEIDIPLPSLEGMEFPPDATGDAGDRLKGIGLLRQLRGTN
jgi:hypothetical protein